MMYLWTPNCNHSQDEYKQLYDFIQQTAFDSSSMVGHSHHEASSSLSLDKRIELLQQILNSPCSDCASDLSNKAVHWLGDLESGLTERAILYLVTAYKIEKTCNRDLTLIRGILSKAFDSCKPQS
ncbi:MAG: hypothetical protein ACXWM7_01585, partial [Parachlamydiaceae bacterium]